MSSPAQHLANAANAQASTGPRTPEGKTASSKNAITFGLFTKCDVIRPGDEDLYAQAKADLHTCLTPVGPLEYNLTDEIHRSMWRLRRCGEVEATLTTTLDAPDPMQDETAAKLQLSVDRARAQAHRLLHKCTAELRKLQTDRQFLDETFESYADLDLGLCDYRAIQSAVDKQVAARIRKRRLDEAEAFDSACAVTQEQAEALLPITKRTETAAPDAAPEAAQIARNAPCPCKSGEKYKRCCGKNAPPVLSV